MILQRREFANYLRKNCGVKGRATSSEIQGACSAKIPRWQWLRSIIGFVMIQKKGTTYSCGGASDVLVFPYDLARCVMRQKQEYLVRFSSR